MHRKEVRREGGELRFERRSSEDPRDLASDLTGRQRHKRPPERHARVVRLSREPLALLSALDTERPLDELPEGEHYVLVMGGGDDLEVLPIGPPRMLR